MKLDYPNTLLRRIQQRLSICTSKRLELQDENHRLEGKVEEGTRDLTTSQNEVQEGADDRLRLQAENHRLEDQIEIGTCNLTTSQSEVQKGVDNGLRLENLNKVLGDEVLRGIQDLREAYIQSLNRLALAAEFRDDQTGHHIQRVSRISALLAKALGLSDGQVELIRIAATLHDVGKIGIPDAILLKPGKLEPDEFEMMKAHTTIGGKIMSGSRSALLQLTETIALTHHECWDGSGYPLGLQGDDIPLAGQIVSIADVWDALTHERPYKKAWTPEESSAEIGRLSGSKFGPRIVKGFQQLFREGLLGEESSLEDARAMGLNREQIEQARKDGVTTILGFRRIEKNSRKNPPARKQEGVRAETGSR